MWAPSLYPLMQKNSHPTTGPMLPVSDMTPTTAYEVFSNSFTLYSNGEWFKECVSNRSPGTPFPSVICYSFSLFPPCLFSYKHPARGLKALSYLKYVNTCQLWTLSIWECFSSLGEKTLQRERWCYFEKCPSCSFKTLCLSHGRYDLVS